MKKNYFKWWFCLCLITITTPLFAQLTTDEANLQRYWSYRERFKKEFVKIGRFNGNSIPMGERTYATPKINWGDGCVHLGYYIATLATEYKLIKDANGDVQPTLNELYYAIEAVYRLDKNAERYFSGNINTPDNFSGFFMRDDVPLDMVDEWFPPNQFPYSGWREFSSNYTPAGITKVNSNNLPSQDQLIALLMGFKFVHLYVDNTYVKPRSTDRGFYIVSEVSTITDKLLTFLTTMHKTGRFNEKCLPPFCASLACPFVDPNCMRDDTKNWWYFNPIADTFINNGLPVFNSYPLAKIGNSITGQDYTEDFKLEIWYSDNGCLKPSFTKSHENFFRDNIWHDAERAIEETTWQTYTGYISLFPNTYLENHIHSKVLENDVNAQMALALATTSGTWKSENIVDFANQKKMWLFDLMDGVLNGRETVHKPQSFYQTLLSHAPCEGPHFVEVANRPSSPYDGWWESNRWLRPTNTENGIGSEEEYNGLDYMLLYNLYHLSFSNNLPAYNRDDITCSCETSLGFYKYLRQVPDGDDDGRPLYHELITEVDNTLVINKVFPEYEEINITTPEHLNHEFTVKSGGKLDIRAYLNVAETDANAGIIVENNGELVIGGTAAQEISVTRFFRNTMLNLQSGAKVIINNNSTLVIDKTALLIMEDGAEIILNGTNAVLEIREPILFESGGNYTFSGGTNGNGYVRFNMAEMKRLASGVSSSNITLNFVGTSMSDKIIEVTGMPLWVDDKISHINIQDGKIEIEEGQKMILQSPLVTMDNLNVDALTPGTKHDGIELFGQQANINFCHFNNGVYGIKSFSIYGGHKLKLGACSFIDCYYGIWAQDKGLDLTGCIFTDCRTSIKAIGMSFSSRFKDMQSFNNVPSYGFPGSILTDYRGASTSSLKITRPIYYRYKYGIRFSGNTASSICGIYNGANLGEYGFQVRFMSSLDLGITSDAGNNLVFNNWNAIEIDEGNLYLNEGTNSFNSINHAVEGSGFGRGSNNSIMANHNFWTYNTPQYPLNILATSAPPPTHTPNYRLGEVVTSPSGGTTINPIPIIDNAYLLAPPSMGACMQCCQQIILNGYRPTNDLLLNTPSFNNVPLSNAVEIVLDSMYPDSLANNLNVIDMFHEILTYPYPILLDDDQEDLLEFTYDKMAEAVGNAYLNEQLTNAEPGINPYVQKLLDVQVIMATRYDVPGDNYEDRIRKAKYHIDQATTHRLVEDRATALTILNNMYSWETNPSVISEITTWDCIISREQLLLDSIIDIDSFLNMPLCEPENYAGSGAGGTAMPFFTSSRTDEVYTNNFSVYPNPFYTTTTIEYTLSTNSNVNISIVDINGKEVFSYSKQETKGKHQVVYDSENMAGGIYFCKIKAGNYTQTQKLILIK